MLNAPTALITVNKLHWHLRLRPRRYKSLKSNEGNGFD